MPFVRTHRLVHLLAMALLAALAGIVAFEPASSAPVVRTWTGSGANNNWTTAANWDAGPPVEGDILVFPAVANRKANTNDFPNFTEFEEIRLQGSGYTLAGNRAVVTEFFVHNPGGGINTVSFIIDGDADLLQQSGRLELMAANSHAGNSIVSDGELYVGNVLALGEFGSTLDIYGGVATIAAPGEYYQDLDIGGASAGLAVTEDAEWWGDVQLFGPVEFDIQLGRTLKVVTTISGGGAVTKSGGGTLYLRGENTFAGVLEITHGMVRVDRDGALGGSSDGTIVREGAVLELFDSVYLHDEPIYLEGILHNASHINHVDNLVIADDAEIRVSSDILRLTNGIDESDPGLTLLKTGEGTLDIHGVAPGSFAGTIDLDEGELAVRAHMLSDVRIQGGMLTGDGRVGDVEGIEGRIIPGVGDGGTLKVGKLDLSSGMWVDYVLDSAAEYTQIKAEGIVSLDDPVLFVGGAGAVAQGMSATLLLNDSGAPIDGEFLLRPEGSSLGVSGTFFELTYLGGPGHDFVLTPESDAEDIGVTIAGSGAAAPSALYTFEVRVRNFAEAPSQPLLVELIIPQGAQFVSSDSVICSFITEEDFGDIYDCAIPAIAAGGLREFDVVAAVTASAPPQIIFKASVDAVAGDPPGNNAAEHTVHVAPGGLGYRIGLPAVARDGGW